MSGLNLNPHAANLTADRVRGKKHVVAEKRHDVMPIEHGHGQLRRGAGVTDCQGSKDPQAYSIMMKTPRQCAAEKKGGFY